MTEPKKEPDTMLLSADDLKALADRCARAVDEQIHEAGVSMHFTVLLFSQTQGSILLPDQQKTPVTYVSSADRGQMLTAMRDFLRVHTH